MINLIPNEEKKKITKDFYLRVITIIFIMLGAVMLIASILLLPAYFIFSANKNSANPESELLIDETSSLPSEDPILIAKDLKNKLSIIENTQKNKFIFSQKIINEIILQKTPGIKITEISYQNDNKIGRTVSVSGSAKSREILLSFRRALENDPTFSKVDLPISNFVKGSNIKFFLNLISS